MKFSLTSIFLLLCLLLTGCATTIRSEVSVAHQWPSDLADKSFVFEVPPSHQANADYAAYQDMVRNELVRLGFTDAGSGAAKLKVAMHYSTTPVEIKVFEPIIYADPFWTGGFRYDPFRYRHRWHRPGWGFYGYYGSYYDPFWFGPPSFTYRESTDLRNQHQLGISITNIADGKKLFEVMVDNNSHRTEPIKEVMPYMIKSAFAQFPGQSGKTHHVKYKVEKAEKTVEKAVEKAK